jgi:hypothetical protein
MVESTEGFPARGALSLPNNRLIGYARKTATSFNELTPGLYDTRPGVSGTGTIVSSFDARLIPQDRRNPSRLSSRFTQSSFADADSPLVWQRRCDVYIAVIRLPDRPWLRQGGETVELIPGENHWETFGYNIFRNGKRITDKPLRPGTRVSLPETGPYTATAVEWSGLESKHSQALTIRQPGILAILTDNPETFSWTHDRWLVADDATEESEARRASSAVREVVHRYDGIIHREWYRNGRLLRRHDLNDDFLAGAFRNAKPFVLFAVGVARDALEFRRCRRSRDGRLDGR